MSQPPFGFLAAVFDLIIFLLFVSLTGIKYSLLVGTLIHITGLSLKNQNILIDIYSDNFHLQNNAREWLAKYWMLSLIQDMHLELQHLERSIIASVVLKEIQKLHCSLAKSITCS